MRQFNYLCAMFLRTTILIITLLCASCASVGSLSGGDEDKSPPQITEGSTPNFQVNTYPNTIQLKFNEWIKLENPNTNISVSPSLQYPIKTKLKGKTLQLKLDDKEILKENTTYSIQFGEAIKDITAGNVSKNLKYVFSTGPYLDSCRIAGSVVDAFSNEDKEKILVGVYDNLNDTAFTKTKPLYYAFTDKSGQFEISNVKASTYHVTALDDKNQNYFYDKSNESIAFFNEFIKLDSQRCDVNIRMLLSLPKAPPQIFNTNILPGRISLSFKPIPDSFSINAESVNKIFISDEKDSVLIWYTATKEINFIVHFDGKSDTLKAPKADNEKINPSLRTVKFQQPVLSGDSIFWKWSEPISYIDSSRINVYSDSILLPMNMSIDQNDPRNIIFKYPHIQSNKIEFLMSDSALISWSGNYNASDTVIVNAIEKNQLARLQIRLDSLIAGDAYIFQILQQKTMIEEKAFIAEEETKWLPFAKMIPGKYTARLISDENRNKQWDAANYEKKLQAEKVWRWEMQELRADWDIEINLKP